MLLCVYQAVPGAHLALQILDLFHLPVKLMLQLPILLLESFHLLLTVDQVIQLLIQDQDLRFQSLVFNDEVAGVSCLIKFVIHIRLKNSYAFALRSHWRVFVALPRAHHLALSRTVGGTALSAQLRDSAGAKFINILVHFWLSLWTS